MSIYVIFRVFDAEAIKAALEEKFSGRFIQVQSDEFLVSGSGTAKDIADELDLTSGSLGSAIIMRMSSYYGRASTEIWDWIKAQAEMSDD